MALIINGAPLDLSHLARVERVVDMQLPNIPKRKSVRVVFNFSCHCYSRSPNPGEAIPAGLFVADGSPAKPRNRIFCQDRYAFSKQIVATLDSVIATEAIVTRTQRMNFFHVDLAAAQPPLALVRYFIFMSAKPKAEPGVPRYFDVFVESAYPETPGHAVNAGGGPSATFQALLGNVWAGVW